MRTLPIDTIIQKYNILHVSQIGFLRGYTKKDT